MTQTTSAGKGARTRGTVGTDARDDPATLATTRSSSMPRSRYSMTRATPG